MLLFTLHCVVFIECYDVCDVRNYSNSVHIVSLRPLYLLFRISCGALSMFAQVQHRVTTTSTAPVCFSFTSWNKYTSAWSFTMWVSPVDEDTEICHTRLDNQNKLLCNPRLTYGCGGEDEKSIFQCVPTALYVYLDKATDYLRPT